MSGHRSFTPQEIQDCIRAGLAVWELDTGNDGFDDHLVAETADEAWGLIEDWLDRPIPAHWELRRFC